MKPIKIAMLSLTHGHSRKYFQTLKESKDFDWIAATAENMTIKGNFDKYAFNVPCYLSFDDMLRNHPDIEAVVLASANDEHYNQMKICTDRGLHMLSMKIPSFDVVEYKEMINIVRNSGVICQVELELHYNPVVKRIKKIIEDGGLGAIQSFNATNLTLSPVWAFPWQGVPESSYGKRIPLRKDEDNRFRGGCLSDHPHIFDLIRWVTKSEFEYVFAEVGLNLRPELLVEDTMVVAGKMKNGVNFLFDPSWSRMEEKLKIPGPGWEVFPKRMEVNINIKGERGAVMADCFGPNIYHNGIPNDRYTVQYTYFDEWIGLMDEFADCIRTKKQPKINLDWHFNTIKVMNACYESIYREEPIYL